MDFISRDMPFWGRGRYYDYYFKRMGLDPDKTALMNMMLCSSQSNSYSSLSLSNCFKKYTLSLLKELNPEDLMPNIQYWLGEVHYAQKNFEKAIIEFGEGLKNYPESIKGPDNLLKLGLSFSNLKKNNEACNVLYELEIKYKDAPKNVLDRAANEIKKLKCPKE